MPKVNAAGVTLIEEFEGCSLRAYPDPGSGGAPWTIGYGHTEGVYPGMRITQAQADQFLAEDLSYFAIHVNLLCSHDLTPNQFAALVSFAYNEGWGALASSSLMQAVNLQEYGLVPALFGEWVFSCGRILPGLVRRRAAEAKLFLTPE